MSIGLTDELEVKTKKGKLAAAKQIFLEGDDETLQQIGDKTHQLEDAIKDISVTGGASTANAVSYNNETSGMTAVTTQGAIDELAAKNKEQDAAIGTKAEKSEVATELDKKFNKENIAQEFGDSKDKVVSQFALPFREIESPEFLKAIVDAENHFLFGIQLDGSIEWGKGIPAPIRSKLQEIINKCQNDKTDILEAINAAKEELSASITALQEGKVDKEEGKSLIEDEVKECFRIIENEEFLKAIVDADDKVLFGFYRATGKPYYPLNEMYHVEQNEEFFAVWLDTANHVLFGIRRDGQIIGEIHAVNALKQVISHLQSDLASLQEKVGTIDPNLKELLDVFSLQENPEYMAVETDAEGKVLSATNPDGSHYIHNVKSETIPEEFGHIEDLEGRMRIETDAKNRILSYRDSDGVKHETNMQVDKLEVSNLNLNGNSADNIKDALKTIGFDVKTPVDWSENKELQIAEPYCAYANIIGDFPTSKGNTTKGEIQFYDMQGNYFKKYIEMDIHGRTSSAFKKKNYTFDFYNDNECSDSFSIKFGDWVAMDSFYFQGWYTDSFRGIDIIGYKLYQEIVSTRGFLRDKPYKYHLMKSSSSDETVQSKNIDINLSKNSLCTPMGFPVILLHNNEFEGIYTIMLKKNRENFLMNKKEYKNVMLDLDQNNIVRGDKNWTSFEIRNPKTLICMDGSKYDGDNPKELIDDTSELYDAGNKDMKNTLITKNAIIGLANAYTEIQSAVSSNNSNEEVKKIIESHFNIDFTIDYMIFSNVIENVDGWGGNWQWTTWDGIIWNPNPYDLNASFGLSAYGITASSPTDYFSRAAVCDFIYTYYFEDIKSRYKELRDSGIISTKNIIKLFNDWINRIGIENFKKEFLKWDTTPSQRNSNLNSEFWERASNEKNIFAFSNYNENNVYNKDAVVWGKDGKLYKSLINNNIGNSIDDTQSWECITYDNTKLYNVGDSVYYTKEVSILFKCVHQCEGQPPVTKVYDEWYGIWGFHDSMNRIYNWVNERIDKLDILLK